MLLLLYYSVIIVDHLGSSDGMLIIMMTIYAEEIYFIHNCWKVYKARFPKVIQAEPTFPSHQSSPFPLQTILYFNTSSHHISFKEPHTVTYLVFYLLWWTVILAVCDNLDSRVVFQLH